MKVVILAGGFGAPACRRDDRHPEADGADRSASYSLAHHAVLCLVRVRGKFVLALGYKAEVVKNFFLQSADMASDLTIDLGPPIT
jgi:hypothetical protein